MKIIFLLLFCFSTHALSIHNCVDCGGAPMPTEPNWRDNFDIYAQPMIDGPTNPQYQYLMYRSPMQSPYMTPWWGNYGMINYGNFNYPGMWNQPGGYFPGQHYPGGGGMAAMKPNIYITGPQGKEFELSLELKGKLLVSAPALDESVRGTLVDGGIKVDDAVYPYLYYDYRMEGDQFQNTKGFCTKTRSLLTTMADLLERSGFLKNEVKDFYQHWMIKIPPAKSYCVYPQGNQEIATESIINLTASQQRLYFVVVPEEATYKGRFASKPEQDWLPPKNIFFDEKQVQMREWAVVFLIN